MASHFGVDKATILCMQSDNEQYSDIDSETQGLSTGEEEEIDEKLTRDSESEEEMSDVNLLGYETTMGSNEIDASSSSDEQNVPLAKRRKRKQRQSRSQCQRKSSVPRARRKNIGHSSTTAAIAQQHTKSYDNPKKDNVLPQFSPSHQPGFHLSEIFCRGTLAKALDFFHYSLHLRIIG